MDPMIARSIAHVAHTGRRDRFGDPLIEHVERVAATVADDVRAIAYLHDVLEHSDATVEELEAEGLTALELATLRLLTRDAGESYAAHTLRVAHARGPEGELARVVKLADLADHLARATLPDRAPPYAWARMHVANAHQRLDAVRGDRAAA
jgi:hypothetical protein